MSIPRKSLLTGFNSLEGNKYSNAVFASVFCENLGVKLPISLHDAPDSILQLILRHDREEILDLQIFENIDTPFRVVLEGIAESYGMRFVAEEEDKVLNMFDTMRTAYKEGVAVDIVIFNAMRLAYLRLGYELINSDMVYDFFSIAMTVGDILNEAIIGSNVPILADKLAEILKERIN